MSGSGREKPARRGRRASRWPVVLGLAVLLIVAGAVLYRRHAPPPNPGRGTPWTVLQDLEAEHRGDAERNTPLLVTHPEDSQYVVLGLPTDDPTLPRTWILLNEHLVDHDEGPVKSVPGNAHFHVDCAYVEQLIAQTPVDPPVASLLRRHCGH